MNGYTFMPTQTRAYILALQFDELLEYLDLRVRDPKDPHDDDYLEAVALITIAKRLAGIAFLNRCELEAARARL